MKQNCQATDKFFLITKAGFFSHLHSYLRLKFFGYGFKALKREQFQQLASEMWFCLSYSLLTVRKQFFTVKKGNGFSILLCISAQMIS